MSNNDLEQMVTPDTKKSIVDENFKNWINEVSSGEYFEENGSKIRTVVKKYVNSEKLSFHPTKWGKFVTTLEDVNRYFDEHFLPSNPTGKIVEEEIKWSGDACYTHHGVYEFTLDSGDVSGERISVLANFSYTWELQDNNEWKIIHHHSSAIPTDEQLKILNEEQVGEKIFKHIVQLNDSGSSLETGQYKTTSGEIIRYTTLLEGKNVLHEHLSVAPEDH